MREEKNLYSDWLPRYQHLERGGNGAVQGLLEGRVYVQEKLDGANLTVAYDSDKESIVIASRNRAIYGPGIDTVEFSGAVEYCLQTKFQSFFSDHRELVLRGEWLVKHTFTYADEHMKRFYVFDVQDRSGSYLSPEDWYPLLESYGILTAPLLATFDYPKLADVLELVSGPSAYGPMREGVVAKRMDFVNRYGRQTWAKFVTREFKEAHRTNKELGGVPGQTPEEKFAALADDLFVSKTIHKIEDQLLQDAQELCWRGAGGSHAIARNTWPERERLTIENMARVIHTVWHDLVREELPDFLLKKKNRVSVFDVESARRLVLNKTRNYALAYFDGAVEA